MPSPLGETALGTCMVLSQGMACPLTFVVNNTSKKGMSHLIIGVKLKKNCEYTKGEYGIFGKHIFNYGKQQRRTGTPQY